MKLVITADIHLHEAMTEEYRWKTFDILLETARRKNASHILILGDLTSKKSGHDSLLVNRMHSEIGKLAKEFPVIILEGNHDRRGTDSRSAPMFFGFLNAIPNVQVIHEITEISIDGNQMIFLPHTSYPSDDWENIDFNSYSHVFFHQAFIGAMASDHYEIDRGVDPKRFADFKGVALGGDIHTGCKVGNLQYVGAPCRINMGDNFTPRIVFLDESGIEYIETGNIQKYLIILRAESDLKKLENLPEDAEIKVRVVGNSEFVNLVSKKVHVDDVKLDRSYIEIKPTSSLIDTWNKFCDINKKSDQVRKAGVELL